MPKALLAMFLVFLAVSSVFAAEAKKPKPQQPQPVKDWTVLVWLNGHNNLDSAGYDDMNEMENVGSNENVNIVVQWASMRASDTKRVYVQKDNDPSKVTSPVIEKMKRVDMGDWKNLVEFIQWGVKNYPAKHYFIDVWNHGGGWHLTGGPVVIRPSDISWDDVSNHFITTEQLADAMREAARIIGHKVDVYGSDACLMGMFEVADEMADAVEVFVGSEANEPGPGWPYDQWLNRWISTPAAKGADIASALVEEYAKSYMGGSQGQGAGTLAAFDLTKLDRMLNGVSRFGYELRKLSDADKVEVRKIAYATIAFNDPDNKDFMDFVARLEGAQLTFADRGVFGEVKEAFADMRIANQTTTRYNGAQGMAIWLPDVPTYFDRYADRYRALRFNRHTGWIDAIEALLVK